MQADLRESVRMSIRELVLTEAAVVVVVVVVDVEAVVVVIVVVDVDAEAVVVVVVVVVVVEAVLEAAPSQVLGQTAALPSMCSPPEVTSVEHHA